MILPSPLGEIYFFIFGAMIGSFLNVCIFRIPLELSVVSPRSHCYQCEKIIAWYDNIPLFSYWLLGGKCRYCAASFSLQYFWIELLSALLCLLSYFMLQPWPLAFLYFVALIAPLIVLTFIDLEHMILPDVITLPLILVGYIVRVVSSYVAGNLLLQTWPELLWQQAKISGAGALVGAGTLLGISFLYKFLRKREGLGMGDVKLAAAFGAFFGWQAVFVIFLFSSVMGSIVGITYLTFSKQDFKTAIPFGPFLALGAVIYLFWGESFIHWYIRFLGK